MKAPKKFIQIVVNSSEDYEIRVETLNGREHWVVPVIMMVEGVHHGSRGRLLYTANELGKFTAAWNGAPVTVGHPQDEEGDYVSANLPEMAEAVIGRIYNTAMDGTKLKAEAWIDITTLRELSEEAYEYLKEHKALDVSVGVFSEEKNVPGEFNGEKYQAAAVNLRPDHLALLPGEVGACSWSDGCGVRVNSGPKNNKSNMKRKDYKQDKADWLATFAERPLPEHLSSNEVGYREVMQGIQNKLNAMDNNDKYHYLEEFFEESFVYRVISRNSGEKFLRQEYSVQEDGTVGFEGSPVVVKKETSFVALAAEPKMVRTNFSNNKTKKDKMKTNATPCSVDALIKNKASGFTEDDREFLSGLPQTRIDAFTANLKAEEEETEEEEEEIEKVTSNKKKTSKKEVTANSEEVTVKKGKKGELLFNGKSIEDYVKESLSKETSTEEFIDTYVPEGMRGQMKTAMKVYNDNRAKMIDEIVANSKFKKEALQKWEDADLTALHDSLVPSGDYSAMGGGNNSRQNNEEADADAIAAMTSFDNEPSKEEKK